MRKESIYVDENPMIDYNDEVVENIIPHFRFLVESSLLEEYEASD